MEDIKADSVTVTEVAQDDFSDMFISSSDTFNIDIKYYKKDNEIFIENFDEEYVENINVKKITFTFGIPIFNTYKEIHEMANIKIGENELTPYDITSVQYARLIVLFRSWSLNKPISEFKNIHPKIVKALMKFMIEAIKFDGII